MEVAAIGSSVEAMTRGEIDIQVATAKRYPRSLVSFKQRALEMATLDQETAESCIYALPREGKTIEGPSARLAEILASAYGHMRVEGKPVEYDDKFVTARGTAWDVQNNVIIAFETKRRITGKNGKRFSDDMIGVTSNAATSIAIRNAVLKVVPKAFWGPIYEACRTAAVGKASTLADTRAKSLAYFQKMGVTSERVFALLEVRGVEDITLEHVATLKGLATAIKEGDTSVDEAFPAPDREVRRASETAKSAAPAAAAPAEQPAGDTKQHNGVKVVGVKAFDKPGEDWYAVVTLSNGVAVETSNKVAAAELEKFSGTSHLLNVSANGLELIDFGIAD